MESKEKIENPKSSLTEEEICKLLQDLIIEEFVEKYKSGKIKNRGDVQLAYALKYFTLEINKRKIELK